MKYLIYTAIALFIVLYIVWQIAVFFIGLSILFFKLFLIVALIAFFVFGWKLRGVVDKSKSNKYPKFMTQAS